MERLRTPCVTAWLPAICETCRFGFQNVPFRKPKRPVSGRKTARIATQSRPGVKTAAAVPPSVCIYSTILACLRRLAGGLPWRGRSARPPGFVRPRCAPPPAARARGGGVAHWLPAAQTQRRRHGCLPHAAAFGCVSRRAAARGGWLTLRRPRCASRVLR